MHAEAGVRRVYPAEVSGAMRFRTGSPATLSGIQLQSGGASANKFFLQVPKLMWMQMLEVLADTTCQWDTGQQAVPGR